MSVELEPTLSGPEDDDFGLRCGFGATSVAPKSETTSVDLGTSVSIDTEVGPPRSSGLPPRSDGPTSVGHSWLPVRLVGVEPVEPPSVGGLLYRGGRHLLSGRSDSGKSMLVHLIEAEQIRLGECVAHIDFEQGKAETLQRLRALGLSDEQIDRQFLYVEPTEPIGGLLPDVLELIERRQPVMVAIDSLGSLAEIHGLDDNKRGDIEKLFRAIITPIAKAGPAVVYLDHLPKATETADVFPIGSERKLGLSDVHLRAETAKPLGRGQVGIIRVLVKRDRSGYLRRGKVAEAVFDSDVAGRITAELRFETESDRRTTEFRPTCLMERVSRWVEAQPEPVSVNKVVTSVTGDDKAIRNDAIPVLVREGYLEATSGARKATLLRSLRPYRQEDDEIERLAALARDFQLEPTLGEDG